LRTLSRIDEELKKETESLVRGAPVESRVEEWREQEGAADGEAGAVFPHAAGRSSCGRRCGAQRDFRVTSGSRGSRERDALVRES